MIRRSWGWKGVVLWGALMSAQANESVPTAQLQIDPQPVGSERRETPAQAAPQSTVATEESTPKTVPVNTMNVQQITRAIQRDLKKIEGLSSGTGTAFRQRAQSPDTTSLDPVLSLQVRVSEDATAYPVIDIALLGYETARTTPTLPLALRSKPLYAFFRLEHAESSTWYFVIDKPIKPDIVLPDVASIQELEALDVYTEEASTCLKIVLARDLVPVLEATGQQDNHFQLRFVSKKALPESTFILSPPSEAHGVFKIQLPRNRRLIEWIPPETDKRVWLVCTDEVFPRLLYRTYPEFNLYRGEMGIAVEVESPNLEYRFGKYLELYQPGGLHVSTAEMAEHAFEQKSLFSELSGKQNLQEITRILKQLHHSSHPTRLSLELIGRYVSMGKFPEALGVVRSLTETTPDIALLPIYRALVGVTQLLLNHPQAAMDSLETLTHDREPKFWYHVAQAIQDVYVNHQIFQLLEADQTLVEQLPIPLKEPLVQKIIEAAIFQKDYDVLRAFLMLAPPPTQKLYGQFLELAEAVLEMHDHPEQGKASMQRLTTKYDNVKVNTLAHFFLVQQKRTQKSVPPQELIQSLEQIRFRWRGDLLEYHITKTLIDLYLEEDNIPKALPLLRQLIRYYVEKSHEDQLPELMQSQLLTYFNQETPPPILTALSVFQEYGDIAPDDMRGDTLMIQGTDMLVQLGLWQDAVALLEKHMTHKIQKEDTTERKQRIAARIAALYMQYDSVQRALAFIESIPADLGNQLSEELRLVKAEALYRAEFQDRALALLEDTPRQNIKKASFLTQQKKCPQALVLLEPLVTHPERELRALAIYQAALCYYDLQDHARLAALRQKYLEDVQGTPYEASFHILTIDLKRPTASMMASMEETQTLVDSLRQVFNVSSE